MKRSIFLIGISLLFVFFHACRKDKSDPPPENTGGDFAKTDIQVILPPGSTVDLSTTKVFTFSMVSSVSADGKASIPFNQNSTELACLFDASDNVLMMGFISNDNKQLSPTSTAVALLYFGLGVTYSATSAARLAALNKIPVYSQFAGFKSYLEQQWGSDPLMLSGNGYMDEYAKTVAAITKIPVIDIKAKQVKVENADDVKSGITVRASTANDESIEVANARLRRSHAFLFKTAYKEKFNSYVTLINTIYSSTAHNEQLPVKSGFVGANNVVTSVVTGPVAIPLQNKEVEAIWKVRIVGPGEATNETLTTDESSKLEQLWVEFFALDLLMPNMLTVLGHTGAQYDIRSGNTEVARPFIDEVKSYLNGNIMSLVKNGRHIEAVKMFVNEVDADYYKRVSLQKKLLAVVRDVNKNSTQKAPVQGDDVIESEQIRTGKLTALVTKLNDGVEIHLDEEIERIYQGCNTLDEWTVKIKDDDVNITPKHSQVMRFTNHTLTVSADPGLSSGQTMEIDWVTAGSYGTLKNGTTEGTTFTTTGKNMTYYGTDAPGDDNIERVIVSVYIKTGSTREFYGSDTATINVKKVKIELVPNGATLTPKKGSKSLMLRLLNADGTNPIVNNSSVQYKVEWSIAGSYGYLSGNTTQLTTPTNNVVYTATDEDVKSATENIIASVYFKLASTGWMLREVVKGTVKIENDPKKIVYYTAPQAFHSDRGNNSCAVGCGVVVAPVDKAISYDVQVDGIESKLYPTYHDSWSATETDMIRGYMGYVLNSNEQTKGNYITGVYGTFSWKGGPSPDHFPIPTCTGTARVTVTVSE